MSEPAVLKPATGVAVAEALRRAADARQSIVIRGAGTKSGWGRPPGRVDAVLDMRGLNRVLAHQHGANVFSIRDGRSTGYAPRTINRRLAALSGLFALVEMRDPTARRRLLRPWLSVVENPG